MVGGGDGDGDGRRIEEKREKGHEGTGDAGHLLHAVRCVPSRTQQAISTEEYRIGQVVREKQKAPASAIRHVFIANGMVGGSAATVGFCAGLATRLISRIRKYVCDERVRARGKTGKTLGAFGVTPPGDSALAYPVQVASVSLSGIAP